MTNIKGSWTNVHLELLSTTDPLTELPNRRVFDARLEEELARSHRYTLPLLC